MLNEAIAYIKNIKSGKYKPLYFLYGQEIYFIDEIINQLVHVTNANKILYNEIEDDSLTQIILDAKQNSIFGNYKLIVVNNAQNKNLFKKHNNIRSLEAYIQHPNLNSILVFVSKESKLNIDKHLLQLLSDNEYIFKLDKLSNKEIHTFIIGYLANRKATIDDKAIEFLISKTGNNLSIIAKELDNIILNNNINAHITIKKLEGYIVNSQDFKSFDFCTMVLKNDTNKALLMLNKYALGKDFSCIYLISLLYAEYSNLLLVKTSSGETLNTNLSPYRQLFYKNIIGLYSYEKLVQVIRLLRIYDLKIKYAPNESLKLDYLQELIHFIGMKADLVHRFINSN